MYRLWPEGKNLLSKWEIFVNHSETLQERHDYDTSFPLVKEIFGASIASLDDIVKEKKKPPPKTKKRKNSRGDGNFQGGNLRKGKHAKLVVQLREKRSSILQDLDDSSSSSAETPGKLFEIEDILLEGVWADVGNRFYFIKWKGYDNDRNSFVDHSNLNDVTLEWWQKERSERYPLISIDEILVKSLSRKNFIVENSDSQNYSNDRKLREPLLQLILEWTESDSTTEKDKNNPQTLNEIPRKIIEARKNQGEWEYLVISQGRRTGKEHWMHESEISDSLIQQWKSKAQKNSIEIR